ncbi:phage portal protein [Sphingomonas colocasiae]|uniref:Phage portal protein n=1 Tax=Sphingomonas colocasiae TaxID=1848973 RepID=A0ABS7Q0M5_9SPHN|nr:phage portal protein [Sphingomonas colocasiae]MBY8826112.1 phage portal protein [Sphingomonas colocasiae]
MTAEQYRRNGISSTGSAPSVSTGYTPMASVPDGGILISSSSELEEALRTGSTTASGEVVNAETAMRVATVFGCVRIRSSAVATTPIKLMRRVDARTREDADDLELWSVLTRRPNKWQKPAVFKRMMQAHVLLRGNAYAAIVRGALGGVQALIPLHPDRVDVKQREDLSLEYTWTRKDGRQVKFDQRDVLHLLNLTLDGVRGVTPLAYARETIGQAIAMERHGSNVFKNGAQVSGALTTTQKLSPEARDRLQESADRYRSGGENAGRIIVLEQGLDYKAIALNQEDAEWIESKKLSRSEICMFFGVPPSMIGDNSGSDSNWGTGLEQKATAFRIYCLEDDYVMWEEALTADCVDDLKVYARFNRNAVARADMKTRWASYIAALQWGVYSPNEVRALEDENPREGGDIYYPPPNTAGKTGLDDNDDEKEPKDA